MIIDTKSRHGGYYFQIQHLVTGSRKKQVKHFESVLKFSEISNRKKRTAQ